MMFLDYGSDKFVNWKNVFEESKAGIQLPMAVTAENLIYC